MRNSILFVTICVFFLSISNRCFSIETKEYHNEYIGLIVKQSLLSDAIATLGNPIKISQVNKTARYKFEDVDISVYSDTGIINSIIIYDKRYKDCNGIQIGDDFGFVKELSGIKIVDSTIFDPHHGIIYWFKHNRVIQIVLIGNAITGK